MVELVLSLVVLACMLDVSGISAYNEFTAVVGISLLTFLYTALLLPLYVLEPALSRATSPYARFCHAHLPLFCLCFDFALTCMLLASFIASAYRCGSTLYIQGVSQHIPLCQSQAGYNVEVSVGLEFVVCAFMTASTAKEWRRVMTEPEPMRESFISKV